MHPPFSAYCRSLYPGGWRAGLHHLRLAWQYHRRDQVCAPLHTHLLCRLGRHEVMVGYHTADDTVRATCQFCPFQRAPTPGEAARAQHLIDMTGGRPPDPQPS